MKRFIAKFKYDQTSIIHTLERANRSGVYTSSGKSLVKEARRKISNHIEFDVYQLKAKIAKDPDWNKSEQTKLILKRLMIYQNELNRFSRKFSEYTGAELHTNNYIRHMHYDFSKLVANLKQRFQKDENELSRALSLLEVGNMDDNKAS
ncbi:MAG: hypothetical protein HRU09_13020 [Oligoflexales bacterium]|nr:hypothetical protein [Oligoflexales bacterium]